VIKEPHITEKSNLQKSETNQVSFKVHRGANKIEIKQAVQTLLKTKVLDVRTMNVRGKRRRMGKKRWKETSLEKGRCETGPG